MRDEFEDMQHALTLENIAALLAPQSGTYYDLWVDGEKIMSAEEPPEVTKARNDNSHGTNFPDSPEPIYGTQYLPRKFKIAVTVAGDNSVDILTNDISVGVVSDSAGEPVGFNLYVGGGMGRTHRIETTFPRLADPLGYVPKEDILYAIKAIVITQRENGRRDNRRYSKLKYLLDSWGIDKFCAEAEKYYGKKFEDFRPLLEWQFNSYLGWQEQLNGSVDQSSLESLLSQLACALPPCRTRPARHRSPRPASCPHKLFPASDRGHAGAAAAAALRCATVRVRPAWRPPLNTRLPGVADPDQPSLPYAELWMGTQSAAPSVVLLSGDPLGVWLVRTSAAPIPVVVARWPNGLPFLSKVPPPSCALRLLRECGTAAAATA
ncbi:hypothetical protein ZWY2020_050357 [Hordeum vulgare]|nr:hypothetical protein ZWY2020_050357 [Hordeum vulgare]